MNSYQVVIPVERYEELLEAEKKLSELPKPLAEKLYVPGQWFHIYNNGKSDGFAILCYFSKDSSLGLMDIHGNTRNGWITVPEPFDGVTLDVVKKLTVYTPVPITCPVKEPK